MSTFDIILAVLLLLGAFKGYRQGFIVEVFSFLAFFIGLFVALKLTIPVSLSLFGESNFFSLATVIVFIMLFLVLSFGIRVLAKALKNLIDFTFFGTLDNLFGAVAGLLKWAFIISIVFWLFDSVGYDIVGRYGQDTVIFPYIIDIGPMVFHWLSSLMPFIRDLIDSMESLPQNNESYHTFFLEVPLNKKTIFV